MHTLKLADPRPWPRHPRYLVHSDGRIIGPSGKERKPVVQRGRAALTFIENGRFRTVPFSVIVCETFHGPRPEGMAAAHENGNALDNRAENLAWKTYAENEADKIRHGTAMLGERHHAAKLTEQDVHEIRAFYATGTWRLWELGAMYGVTETTVSYIVNRKTWRHI